MGMFDTIHCKYPLPDLTSSNYEKDFQTKDFECVLDNYTITEKGRLILHDCIYEEVPEEERQYYGTPEWEKDEFYKLVGCIKTVPTEDIDMNYNGQLNFYTIGEHNEWLEFDALFEEGVIKEIKRIKRDYGEAREEG